MFSKYAFVIPLKNKSGSALKAAFKSIFSQGRVPEKLQTDQGTEFENSIVGQYLHSMGVRQFATRNRQIKCAVVERFNRTIKGRIYKYMTAHETDEYLDVLGDIVHSYNKTRHGVTKMRPVDVDLDDLEDREIVFKNTYGFSNLRDLILHQIQRNKTVSPELQRGDLVRISKLRQTFHKAFKPSWSDMLYKVRNIIKRVGVPVYELTDSSGHTIKKKFYLEELQKITQNMLNVALILKTRRRKGILQHYVQWTANAPEDKCWVNDTDIPR